MALWSSQSGAEEVDGPRSDCERFRCGGLGASIAEKQAAMNSLRLFLVGLMFVTAHGHSSSQIFGQISPRAKTNYRSQGRVVATKLDGLIGDVSRHGLFVGETRLLSCYRYFVDGKAPQTVAVSSVEQHSWLGRYVSPAPGAKWKQDTGSGEMEESSEKTIELKISRYCRSWNSQRHRLYQFHAASSEIHVRD
jgi:hypothetical protein